MSFPDEAASYLDDFRERRELQGLGDSDGLGSDPTLAPPSLSERELRGEQTSAVRDRTPDVADPGSRSESEPGEPKQDWQRAGLLRAQKAENDEHSFGL